MTIFVMLTHGDPATFNFVAKLLYPHKVVVHVDASTNLSDYLRAEHISYVTDRVKVQWGSFSLVDATIAGYDLALEHSPERGEHIVVLSGNCVPVRPLTELDAFLKNSPWKQHIRAGLLIDGHYKNLRRIQERWAFDLFDPRATPPRRQFNALARLAVRQLSRKTPLTAFDGLSVAAGSEWTALTAECIYGLRSERDLWRRCKILLNGALAPDEIFFHTLVYSTNWRSETESPQITGKGNRKTADFANLHYIDPTLTRWLDARDINTAISRGAFFARKVNLRENSDLAPLIKSLVSPEST